MSTLRTNALLDASGGTTATVNGIPLRPGVLDPENRIINGAFDFWQRGTSFTAEGYGAADRWVQYRNGGTATQARQAFAAGDTLGSNNPTYFMRQTVSGQSTAAHFAFTAQRIEGVRSYAGQTITVLGWVRRSSGSGNMTVACSQNFGTGGSPSAGVEATPQTITLTSSWTPFAATFAIPSISGKTLGTDGNDNLAVLFWISAGSNYNASTNSLGLQTIGVDLWGIHIKQGTHTTSAVDLYCQPELGPELARCQRYYQRSVMPHMMGVATTTTVARFGMALPVEMRAGPSISISGTIIFYDGASSPTVTALTGQYPSTTTIQLDANWATGSSAVGRAAVAYNNGSGWSVAMDSEI